MYNELKIGFGEGHINNDRTKSPQLSIVMEKGVEYESFMFSIGEEFDKTNENYIEVSKKQAKIIISFLKNNL